MNRTTLSLAVCPLSFSPYPLPVGVFQLSVPYAGRAVMRPVHLSPVVIAGLVCSTGFAQQPYVAMNSVAWLCGPVERIIAILCHTSSRTLTLLTVATGRWRYFGLGFALMTVLDGFAGYFLLSGVVRTVSAWWIELAIAPFGIASVPIIVRCTRRWPGAGTPQVEPPA